MVIAPSSAIWSAELVMVLLLLVQLTSIAIRQRMIERGRFIFVLLLKYNKQSYNKNTDAPTHIVWCTYFFIGEIMWGEHSEHSEHSDFLGVGILGSTLSNSEHSEQLGALGLSS